VSKTEENLEEAFAGESMASNKYAFFAERAEKDGKTGVAKLFKAAALAEEFHAKNHLKTMGKLKSTEENLKEAIEGENYEHEEMYPGFIETAESEGEDQALKWFDYAMKVEKKHENFYREALDAVEEGGDLEEKEWYVCEVCGNTVEEEPPENCPICGAPKMKFVNV